jgi:hypothetical protein
MGKLGKISIWDWLPGKSWRIVTMVEAADEIPLQLPFGGVVLVGSLQYPKWLVFDCPCKTGHRIMVSLDKKHYPHWSIQNDKKLTISPSVDYQTTGRRCHYFIKRGKIVWALERGEKYHGRN